MVAHFMQVEGANLGQTKVVNEQGSWDISLDLFRFSTFASPYSFFLSIFLQTVSSHCGVHVQEFTTFFPFHGTCNECLVRSFCW